MSSDFALAGRFITLLALVCVLWQVWNILGLSGLQLSGAAQSAESVVQVKHRDVFSPWGFTQGSGFIWDKEGHIVTNYNIVHESNDLTVQFAGGEECPARVLGASPDCDLAVLELVDCQRPNDALPLGLSWLWPRVGDRIATFGSPGAWSPILSEGVVAGTGRTIRRTFRALEMRHGMRRFMRQCDVDGVMLSTATVGFGSRGGPVLSPRGKVVGLSTWRFASARFLEPILGRGPRVTGAISAHVLRRVVPRLIEEGHYHSPVTGLEGQIGPARFLFDEHAAVYPAVQAVLPQFHWGSLLGVRAAGCRLWGRPGDEAREVGLRRLDEVTRLGWWRVQTPEDAMAIIQRTRPGAQLVATYRRPGDRPGYVRRTALEVGSGEPVVTKKSLTRRWLKRSLKAFAALRLAQMVSEDDLNWRAAVGQRRGPVRHSKKISRITKRNLANAGDDAWSVIRPRGPIRWWKKIARNVNFDFMDFGGMGWPRRWRFPGQFTFFDSGFFGFGGGFGGFGGFGSFGGFGRGFGSGSDILG